MGMKKEKKLRIQEYFEGIELTEEYEPYFCSIAGTFCGFRNLKQIQEWASHEKIKAMLLEEFGVKHVPCYYWLTHLLKIVDPKSMNECFTQWVT
ncbi:MAG: transposase family protein, partial [Oscillospiraceae bacterium]|nr:transposase family protein [Oscillospiraceae bacterium]